MDIATLGGLIVGIGAIVVAFLMEGGHLSMVFEAPAMILVIFGTLGATAITTSFTTISRIPKYLKLALMDGQSDAMSTIERLVKMAERARREGILGLEADLKHVKDPFFAKVIASQKAYAKDVMNYLNLNQPDYKLAYNHYFG